MKSKTKLLLLISDLHVGSTVGLWPSGFVSSEGYPIGQNKFQEWLWQCWGEAMKWADTVIGKDAFDLVLNGDLVDGIHHKTVQVMSPCVGDQTTAVLSVLGKMVGKADKIHVVKGTECHTRGDEIRIGHELRASRDPMTGQHAWDSLDLEQNGTLFNFAHHISTTARPYLEAGGLSIALGSLTISRARTNKPVPLIMCRGHRHRHAVFNDGNQMAVVTGAWQGLTRYGYKVVPDAVPQPSIVIFDARNTAKGDLPLVHQKVFTAK